MAARGGTRRILLSACEAYGDFATLTRQVLVPLITAKRRPIGLFFPAFVRLWAAARKKLSWAWCASVAHLSFAADAGCSTTETVWRGSVRACPAVAGRRHAAELMVDVSKCVERVPYHLLISTAAQLGYPMRLLRLSLRT